MDDERLVKLAERSFAEEWAQVTAQLEECGYSPDMTAVIEESQRHAYVIGFTKGFCARLQMLERN